MGPAATCRDGGKLGNTTNCSLTCRPFAGMLFERLPGLLACYSTGPEALRHWENLVVADLEQM